jgi:purine nucleosidase
MPRKFLIDTDTASDDAVALMMALNWPDVEVVAITVVAGNIELDQCVRNALYTAEVAGKTDVPVYRGAEQPLVRKLITGDWFHGSDGMGDNNYPEPQRKPETKHAVQAIIDTVRANPGIELVTLGPLTNIALALRQAPDIVPLVSRCVVMGGAANVVGNVTPAAEFNIWVDPEAAQIVFLSGLPIEMVGWELCRHEANIMVHEMEMILGFDTPLAHLTVGCNRRALESCYEQSREAGLGLADPVAMAVALDPTICTRKSKHRVMVETQSELTRGMTVVDQIDVAHDERNRATWAPISTTGPNVTVCWEIDIPRWKEALYSVLR